MAYPKPGVWSSHAKDRLPAIRRWKADVMAQLKESELVGVFRTKDGETHDVTINLGLRGFSTEPDYVRLWTKARSQLGNTIVERVTGFVREKE